ncbi:MAG: hypothetical protein JWR08_1442 [Enterovirga sp.]|nr:hypothetical protein [Enterovirga sp.]
MTRLSSRLTFGLLAGTALCGALQAVAAELPTGPSVAYGAVSVGTPRPNAMAIQQTSQTAIVNWQGFSIGTGARVDAQQPSASATLLNRVTGSTPSTIAGQLNANGRVYLVNPNGIAITPTGIVRAAGFVASTLDIADEDFKAGRRSFAGHGRSAAVVNAGTIDIGAGGYAALIGGQVENSGLVNVPMGRVGFGAGESVTLDVSGDGFLQVSVPSEAGVGTDRALIRHSGTIRAPGGRVEMQAASLREAARQTINLSGVVEARSIGGRSGAIVLGGGGGGTVTVSGRLDASATQRSRRPGATARSRAARGGDITITGDAVRLTGATLDASGATGGGTIRVGGEYKGGGTLQRASTTTVGAATTIRSDATVRGDGGQVVLWSDQTTSFAGLISARGGPQGGNGGFAEVSGRSVLAYNGTADLSAAAGAFGTLLLDPYNVTISSAPDSGTTTAPGTLNTPIGPQTGTQFTPNADDSNINAATLLNALASANVIVTTGTGGSQTGNITVLAPLSWTAPTNLALNAAGAIVVAAPITASAGSLALQSVLGLSINAPVTLAGGSTAFVTGGNMSIAADVSVRNVLFVSAGNTSSNPGLPAIGTVSATGAVSAGAFQLNRGNWVQNAAALPAFRAGTFTVATGTASFLRAQGGDGSAASPFLIADVYGLQGMGTSAALLAGNYALANDIDASGTALWNGNAGFVPIGFQTGFTGSLDGRGRAIDGLAVNRPGSGGVGLFGTLGGTVGNVRLTNVRMAGNDPVGALAGVLSAGATVADSASSGSVSGVTAVGGLVGSNSGTIANSSSSAAVSGTGNDAGGLVGENRGGTITGSSASGPVGGSAFHVGGLLGHNYDGTVTNSSASGTAQSTNTAGGAGGLVGENDGTVTLSFATGAATAPVDAGGLVGTNTGTISRSYATGAATGSGSGSSAIGGLAGSSSGSIADAFASGAAAGGSGVGGLVGRQTGGSVARSYAFGSVAAPAGAGGLIGTSTGTPSVTNSVFDTQATGQSASAGGAGAVGQTTAQIQAGLPAGFSPNVYGSGIEGRLSYPFLLGLPIPASILASTTNPVSAPAQGPVPGARDVAAVSPTLSRQLPQSFASVNTVPAQIDFALVGGGGAGAGGGPSLGTGQGSGSGTTQTARETLSFIQRSSANLDRRIAECERRGAGDYKNCVGGALGQYATDLESRILQLPPPLRAVTAVIRAAARQVQAAGTVAEARGIVRAAVAEVRKAIALIRADEPAVARLQVRQGNAIAGALQSVETRLARAVGL